MKSTGIVRKMDELGRIVIPIELRRQLEIEERDAVEIYTEKDMIILRKYQNSCIFCQSNKDLVAYNGKFVCKNCIEKLGK